MCYFHKVRSGGRVACFPRLAIRHRRFKSGRLLTGPCPEAGAKRRPTLFSDIWQGRFGENDKFVFFFQNFMKTKITFFEPYLQISLLLH